MAGRAKTKATRRAGKHTRSRRAPAARRSAKRQNKQLAKRAKVKRPKKTPKRATVVHKTLTKAPPRPMAPRLDRARRVLQDTNESEAPSQSSLDAGRYAGAARSGRKSLDRSLHEHTGMTPSLTGGDVDADWENAYFSGDEAPGGDNPTPDQEVVDDIGQALGVQYQDDEELKGSDKVIERDKHRWELDPASADDYKKNRD